MTCARGFDVRRWLNWNEPCHDKYGRMPGHGVARSDRVGIFRLHPISGFAEDRIPLKMTVFVVAELVQIEPLFESRFSAN